MSPLNITQPLGIWSTRWLLFWVMSNIPKSWDIYQPLNMTKENLTMTHQVLLVVVVGMSKPDPATHSDPLRPSLLKWVLVRDTLSRKTFHLLLGTFWEGENWGDVVVGPAAMFGLCHVWNKHELKGRVMI